MDSFERGLDLCGHDALGGEEEEEEEGAEDALECQKKCEKEERCHFFTFKVRMEKIDSEKIQRNLPGAVGVTEQFF